MITRAKLAIILSKLKGFEHPDASIEQYMTDSEVASQMLWSAFMLGDIEDKVIGDLGCGTGILGSGALLLGAKFVFFVDQDEKALGITKENLRVVDQTNYVFFEGDVREFSRKVEVVIQNPPFGVQSRHADRVFLKKAFELASVVYSLHKIESQDFVDKISEDYGFKVTHLFRYSLPIKRSMKFHTKRIERVQVGWWRFERV